MLRGPLREGIDKPVSPPHGGRDGPPSGVEGHADAGLGDVRRHPRELCRQLLEVVIQPEPYHVPCACEGLIVASKRLRCPAEAVQDPLAIGDNGWNSVAAEAEDKADSPQLSPCGVIDPPGKDPVPARDQRAKAVNGDHAEAGTPHVTLVKQVGILTFIVNKHLVWRRSCLLASSFAAILPAFAPGAGQPPRGKVAAQECLCWRVPVAAWHSWQAAVSVQPLTAASLA